MRRFYACRFRTTDTRDYAYHWEEGEPFAPGSEVAVAKKKGDGTQRVFVVSRYPADYQPTFTTKPIVGPADPVPAQEAQLIAAELGKRSRNGGGFARAAAGARCGI
jgi:hypothetical protein